MCSDDELLKEIISINSQFYYGYLQLENNINRSGVGGS
jgi:hypothetical protein